jgi:hypothetical protein
MYIGLHIKYRLVLLDCNETWIFLKRFSKNSQIVDSALIRSAGSTCSMRKDGKTRWSPKVAFQDFANLPEKEKKRWEIVDLLWMEFILFNRVTSSEILWVRQRNFWSCNRQEKSFGHLSDNHFSENGFCSVQFAAISCRVADKTVDFASISGQPGAPLCGRASVGRLTPSLWRRTNLQTPRVSVSVHRSNSAERRL